ncbi:hypothetical protein HK098_005494 [Nowakowskiella sp. JEL0407]|nr:hypothetical protein HK098_005494 [Nowakowskiella sp. JEL0407]
MRNLLILSVVAALSSSVAAQTCVAGFGQCGGKVYTVRLCSFFVVDGISYLTTVYLLSRDRPAVLTVTSCVVAPSPASSPSPSPAGNCQAGLAQCDGQTYTGVKCCVSGYTCKYVSQWYSQCVVSSGTTPSPSPTVIFTPRPSPTVTSPSPRSPSPIVTSPSPSPSPPPVSSPGTVFDPRPACNGQYKTCSPCCGYGLTCQNGSCTATKGAGAPSHWVDPPTRPTGGAPAPPAGYKPVGPFSTKGRHIIDSNGYRIKFVGVNWFGGETSIHAPHGLWGPNYKTTLDLMKSLGFTLIRLPWGNDMIKTGAKAQINAYTNPELDGLSPLEVFDKIIDYCNQLGIFILLDRHTPNDDNRTALWYTDAVPESKWISDWQVMATRYKNAANIIGADLHNEPHSTACWGCGDAKTDWLLAAIKCGNAVHQVAPHWLIIVEGVDSYNGDGSDNVWWGGALGMAALKPVTLTIPNKVVYSPHEYAVSVYEQPWFGESTFPANLPKVWYHHWAHLYYNNVAPILVGEFGSTLVDSRDSAWMKKLVEFMGGNDSDGMSWTFWSWNPDSGDTGGIVGEDWLTPNTAKMNIIKPGMWNWF